MPLKRTLAASAAILAVAGAANAADFGPVVTGPPTIPPPITVYSPSFDWGGLYVGAYGGYVFGPGWIQAGAQAGYNFVNGGILMGAELQAGLAWDGGAAFEGWANARIGALLGSNLLLYAEGGLGMIGFGGQFLWAAGGGVEMALGQTISLFAEAKVMGPFGACCGIIAQGGINWHPGN